MSEHNEKEYFLANGHFQLPIYWGNISSYMPMEQLHNRFPSIPCASILVSIGQPGTLSAPDYDEGAYNTTFFQVDELEYRLFQEQVRR